MKKTGLIVLLLSVSLLVNSKNSNAQDAQGKNIPLEYNVEDSRFSLENISFFKRLNSTSSKLNVSFEMHNKTDSDIKLKVFLIAFRRIDAVDSQMRKLVSYPKWRKLDLDKIDQKNILLDSVPAIDKNTVDSNVKGITVYPEYQKYLKYISENPDMGKDVVIQGFNSTSVSDDGTKEFYAVTYPLKTNVYGQLSVKFNEKNLFFNYLGIVVVDPSEKKIAASKLFYFRKPMRTF